jgi:CO dehydrogenase/acetyl-CoA synthase gamma subunit (corrinoid Fe-S protein)
MESSNMEIAQIGMSPEEIAENVESAVYSLVPMLMAASANNHTKLIQLSIEGSIKLAIYNKPEE